MQAKVRSLLIDDDIFFLYFMSSLIHPFCSFRWTLTYQYHTNDRHIARTKRSQVPAQYVRHILLHRARVHATIETPGIDGSTNGRDWDNVGGILDV